MKIVAAVIILIIGIFVMAHSQSDRFNWRGKDEYYRKRREHKKRK